MLGEPALEQRFRAFIGQVRESLPEVLVASGGGFLQERCASVSLLPVSRTNQPGRVVAGPVPRPVNESPGFLGHAYTERRAVFPDGQAISGSGSYVPIPFTMPATSAGTESQELRPMPLGVTIIQDDGSNRRGSGCEQQAESGRG